MAHDWFNVGSRCGSKRPSTGRRGGSHRQVSYRPEVLTLECRTLPSTIAWLRPVGGDWDDPANWAGGRIPGAGDDAVIPFAGIQVTHAANRGDSARSLQTEAALDISAGSLTIDPGAIGSSRLDALVPGSGWDGPLREHLKAAEADPLLIERVSRE